MNEPKGEGEKAREEWRDWFVIEPGAGAGAWWFVYEKRRGLAFLLAEARDQYTAERIAKALYTAESTK